MLDHWKKASRRINLEDESTRWEVGTGMMPEPGDDLDKRTSGEEFVS